MQRTNKRDVEKVLLRVESFRRTLLLLIEGVFTEAEPDLSAKILAMYHRCPLIFQDYLQLGEHIPDEHIPELDELDELDDLNETEALKIACYRDIRPRSLLTEKETLENFQIPLRLTSLEKSRNHAPVRTAVTECLRDRL